MTLSVTASKCPIVTTVLSFLAAIKAVASLQTFAMSLQQIQESKQQVSAKSLVFGFGVGIRVWILDFGFVVRGSGLRLWVSGFGIGIQGSGFSVRVFGFPCFWGSGSGFVNPISGFRVSLFLGFGLGVRRCGFEVVGLGFGVWVSGVSGLGFGFVVWVSGLGFRGFGFGVQGFGVQGFGVQGFGVRGSGFGVRGSGFEVQGSGFGVYGLGFKVRG
ncbi:uncharacterized protein LOC127149932 [Cucumis melo]|uniref:Uncharacterized protein LOC127149932 n=1 Tax=Cucumis melo TaxID=3656 RepID=A0ABM3KWX8_CUCME|nr:uncharacterized protein LOC127149932 [Cucumis melo]